jgi:hypothetical protein
VGTNGVISQLAAWQDGTTHLDGAGMAPTAIGKVVWFVRY